MDLTERELLAAIARLFGDPAPDVVVGVGDDAAIVRAGSGDLVLTTDALVQDQHFDLAETLPRDLGAKSVTVGASDLAAMAASPRFGVCALTLSDRVDAAWAMDLFGGIREACEAYALRLVGGNLSRSEIVSVTVSLTGEVAPGRAVRRSGATVGDRIVVTGALGGAAAGLRLGRRRGGWSEVELGAIRRQVRPTARVGEAAVLASHGATAMIDVSDGLVRDLGRICEASGVGALLQLDQLPVDPAATRQEALGGGEDYELVASFPTAHAVDAAAAELRSTFGTALTAIGTIAEGPAIVTSIEAQLDDDGWDHFAARS